MRVAVALFFVSGVLASFDSRLSALAQDKQEAQEQPELLKVDKEWSGGKTLITTAEVHRVLEAESWAALWERHAGKKARAPEVDFERHMVVACFLGPVTYDRVSIYSVRKTKEEILFGIMLEEEDCCDFSAQPQHYIAVVPRSAMKLTVIARVKADLDVDPKKDKILAEIPARE